MRGIIYKTTCLITGKIYIGQHKIFSEKTLDPWYIGSGPTLLKAIEKYGRENFKREILKDYIPSKKLLNVWEYIFTKKYNSTDPKIGYNIVCGSTNGMNCDTYFTSLPEVREKIRQSKIGSKNPRYGIKEDEETRRKKSSSMIGKNTGKLSDEHKKKLSIAKKGKKLSDEHKQHIKEAMLKSKRKYSEKGLKKISETHKGKKVGKETKQKLRNANLGNRYITNGVITKVIKSDEFLEKGWRYGRAKK